MIDKHDQSVFAGGFGAGKTGPRFERTGPILMLSAENRDI
jgi:hypothetical protein